MRVSRGRGGAGADSAGTAAHLPPSFPSQSRQLESAGLSRGQSDALTELVARTLCTNREKISAGFVSHADLAKTVFEHEARVAAFRAEVSKSQDFAVSSLTRDAERLTGSLDKVRAEIRYEVDKLTSATRLDLNLEKGRMRDELQALRDKAAELEIKIDRETSLLKASIETTKNEALRFSIGVMVTFGTFGLGVARLLM